MHTPRGLCGRKGDKPGVVSLVLFWGWGAILVNSSQKYTWAFFYNGLLGHSKKEAGNWLTMMMKISGDDQKKNKKKIVKHSEKIVNILDSLHFI